jgi:ribosomal-protein-alanine N-acetyltransferase
MMPATLKSERIYLRPLTLDDASEAYVAWLNNKAVNQYLVDVSRSKHDLNSVRDFITHINSKDDEFMFGIFLIDSNQHIGNIKIGPVRSYHLVADIGFLIGEQSQWGKGYGVEAIKLASDYAFNILKLNKLSAGLYASNVACARALEKAGFQKEGVRIKHYLLNGVPEDIIEYGACHDTWGKL